MNLEKYKQLTIGVGNPDADYERQEVIKLAAAMVGEPNKVGYWIGRFGGPKAKKKIPVHLIEAMAKRAQTGKNPPAVLNSIIKRWHTPQLKPGDVVTVNGMIFHFRPAPTNKKPQTNV